MTQVVEMSPMTYGNHEVISRKDLKPYLKRSDVPGLINLFGHLAILSITGYAVHLSIETWLFVPVILIHSFVLVFLFAPIHECSHGTPFRTRWLNESVFAFLSFIWLTQPIYFRYSHAAHHTYTNIRGLDPDVLLPKNATIWSYLWHLSSIPFWKTNLAIFFRNVAGQPNELVKSYTPEIETPRMILESRIYFLFYLTIAALAIYFKYEEILIYWIVPRFLGEPFMRLVRLAEHAECEESGDLRKNTRTTNAPKWFRFLHWNMSFHSEHHISPLVPFHALPGLHRAISHKLYPVGESYGAVHAEIIGNLVNHRGVTWADSRNGSVEARGS